MVGKLKITIGAEESKLYFSRTSIGGGLSGDLNTVAAKLQYYDGFGETCLAGDILYTEGDQSVPDFIEIVAKFDSTLIGNGILDVDVNIQYITPGTNKFFDVTILGSPIFQLEIVYQ